MKILHLIYDDMSNPWLGGGGARRTFEIYRRFPKDCQIKVVTARSPKSLPYEKIENIDYHRVGFPYGGYLLNRISYSIAAIMHILKSDYDLLIEDYTAFSPCFSFFFTKKPVIGSFQNLHSQKDAKGKGLFKTLGAEVFDKIALYNFKHFMAVSPNLQRILQESARNKSHIKFIGVGVDHELFSIQKKITSESPILYIGRIEIRQKGLDTLLNAYSKLKNRPRLLLAGRGVDTKRVMQMADKLGIIGEIELTGPFSQEKKKELLQNALFVVMPSRYEGFPVVPIEAMASGNAFAGTKIPGLTEIVGENAILVEKENVDELTIAMQTLIDDKEKRTQLAIQGRSFCKQYEWSEISKQFYKDCIDTIG